jgi:hypothetical protein
MEGGTEVENRVLRRIFGPERDEGKGEWRKVQMRSLVICIVYPIFLG